MNAQKRQALYLWMDFSFQGDMSIFLKDDVSLGWLDRVWQSLISTSLFLWGKVICIGLFTLTDFPSYIYSVRSVEGDCEKENVRDWVWEVKELPFIIKQSSFPQITSATLGLWSLWPLLIVPPLFFLLPLLFPYSNTIISPMTDSVCRNVIWRYVSQGGQLCPRWNINHHVSSCLTTWCS